VHWESILVVVGIVVVVVMGVIGSKGTQSSMCALILCIFLETVDEQRVVKVITIFSLGGVGCYWLSGMPRFAFD
jgi:hypothetical protein